MELFCLSMDRRLDVRRLLEGRQGLREGRLIQANGDVYKGDWLDDKAKLYYYSPDTLFEGWTLTLDGWTLGLDGWIFYFHELLICLIFSLLKVILATSDLYSFCCLTIIIYNVLETKGTTLLSQI